MLRIEHELSKITNIGLGVNLQIGYLDILKTNLLSVDFEYSREESQKVSLLFTPEEMPTLEQDPYIQGAVATVLAGRWGRDEERELAPYIQAHEERLVEKQKFQWQVLLFGGYATKRTESLAISGPQGSRRFYRHTDNRSFSLQDPLTRLLSDLFSSLLSFGGSQINRIFFEDKEFVLEYQHEKNLINEGGGISSEQRDFTLRFGEDFYVGLKLPLLAKSAQKKILKRLEGHAHVGDELGQWLASGALKPPLRLQIAHEVSESGILHLNLKEYRDHFDALSSVCGARVDSNSKFFKKLFNGCLAMKDQFDAYWMTLTHFPVTARVRGECDVQVNKRYSRWNPFTWVKRKRLFDACVNAATVKTREERNLDVPLSRLKSFLVPYFHMVTNREELTVPFGEENVFTHGQLTARTGSGGTFQKHIRIGQFRGLGAVDSYQREVGQATLLEPSRSPASASDKNSTDLQE